MSRDSRVRILSVAFCLCLVCSILVSVAAVLLKDRQNRNREMEKKRNILQIARLYDTSRPVDEQFGKVQARILDLEKGALLPVGTSTMEKPAEGRPIPAAGDIAGIRVRPRFREVYLVSDAGILRQLILPVYGKGLWSTMYGFIALGPDCSTVTGFGFYEHGETPGLGGEIENPAWLAQWPGKKVYDQSGAVRLSVAKGAVDRGLPSAVHSVDGLSGATLTARGVSNLIAYWLGENGYGPFLQTIRKSGGVLP